MIEKRINLKLLTIFVCFSFLFLISHDTFFSQVRSKAQEAESLWKEGWKAYKNGEYDKAIALYSRALNLTQDKKLRLDIYFGLSLSYFALDEVERAREFIKMVLEINPNFQPEEKICPPGYIKILEELRTEEKLKKEGVKEEKPKAIEKPVEKRPKKTGKTILYIVIGALVVGVGGYFLFAKKKESSQLQDEHDYDTRVLGIQWIQVPAGEFKMGDNFGDGDSDERPVHTVYLDTYYISKYEVTFEQYDKFCEATGRTKPSDNGWGRGNRPVINVSWDDAKAFCNWLSQKTGKKIHLPTEAQWEKAARGTDQRKYPWGNSSPNCNLANFLGCSGKTQPVGSYPSGVSPYGVMDMAGNVWEWCQDWYASNYYSYSPYSNPQGPSSGSYHVLRGGGWNDDAWYIRSANRPSSPPSTSSYPAIGFRLSQEVK